MKAKHTTKKALSVLLALLMLVMVFPAGVVTITAAGTDGDFKLNDTDTTYTIDGPLDWNIVAGLSADGQTFAGMTIKLAADINGANLPEGVTLTTPLFKTFAGTFTGLKNASGATNADKYYTIKNITATATAGKTGVIVAQYNGTTKIENLNLEKVKLTATNQENIGLLVGSTTATSSSRSITLTVNNVYATNCEISGKGTAGLLIGNTRYTGSVTVTNVGISGAKVTATSWNSSFIVAASDANLHFENIELHGTINGSTRTGGALGVQFDYTNNAVDLINVDVLAGTTISLGTGDDSGMLVGEMIKGSRLKFIDCNVAGSLSGRQGLGMMVGALGEKVRACTEVTVQDCTVTGSVTGTGSYGIGGIIGKIGLKDSTVTIKNVDVVGLQVTGGQCIGGVVGNIRNWDKDGDATPKVSNVTVKLDDVDLTGVTVTGTNSATLGVGGMFGGMHNVTSASISVKNSDLKNITVTAPSSNMGLVIGRLTQAIPMTIEDITLSGTNTVTSTFGIEANIESTASAGGRIVDDTGLGGLIGTNQSSGTGGVTIDGVTIEGALNLSHNARVGALIGRNASSQPLSVKNVTFNATMDLDSIFTGAVVAHLGGAGSVTIDTVNFAGDMSLTSHKYSHTYGDNKTFKEDGDTGGLIGYSAGTGAMTINNVTTSTAPTLTAQGWVGGMIGNHSSAAVTITNSTMNLNVNGASYVGGLFGLNHNKKLTVENVKLSGTVTATGTHVGGIVGYSNSVGTESNPRVWTLTNIESDLIISTTTASGSSNAGLGGLIGTYGKAGGAYALNEQGEQSTASNADLYDPYSTLDIENVLVKGSIGKPNATDAGNNSVGGLIGYMGYSCTTINVKNSIVAPTFTTQLPTTKAVNAAGIIIGRTLRSGLTLNVINVSTTYTDNSGLAVNMIGDAGSQPGASSVNDYTINVNGIKYLAVNSLETGESDAEAKTFHGPFDLQSDVIAVITDAELAKMVTYGADGYIDSIRGHVVGGYEQHTAVGEDGTYSIRFIALVNQNDENVAEYGISLRMTDAEGTVTYYVVTCEAYETLEGFDREGLPAYEYDAMNHYGAKKFLAAVATGVPAEALTFDVIAWYTTHSGVTVYDTIKTAQYSATAVLVNAL